GASTRNGGITSASIRPDYATISRRFGEDKALAIEAEGKTAREFLYEFIRTERLECDFQLVGQFKASFGYEQYETMARNADALAKRLRIESHAVPYAEQRNYIGTDIYRGRTVPVRSRIIATEELAPDVMARLMPKRMMMTENRQVGFYYRPSPDGKRI